MATLNDFISDVSLREREELEQALLKGEDIFWAVKPVPAYWGEGSAALAVFATIWLSFIAFWTFGALGMPTSAEDLANIKGEQIPFALFSIPFWLVGLGLASAPWWRKRKLESTVYVLTNKRALIVERGLFSWSSHVYPLEEDMLISRTARKGGLGDLILEIDHSSNPPTKRGFMSVPDVSLAEDKLNEAIARKGGVGE